jgi:MFS transporter, FSR family, fosmidomycin resistance protein
LAHSTSHFSHLILPLMFPVFVKVFGLSYAALGLLMTVYFSLSAVGQVLAGFVVDRFGARPVLIGSVFLLGSGCVIAALSTGYLGLLACAICLGLGNASFHPADYTIFNQRVSPARLGYAYSAHGLTGNLGWAVAPVFMAGLNGLWNWQVAFMGAASMIFSILLLLLLNPKDITTEVVVHSVEAPKTSALTILKLPILWWCFGFFLFSTIMLSVVQNFGMTIMRELFAVGTQSATTTLTAYMLCAALGMFTGGFVATRWPTKSERVVASCMCTGALLVALSASTLLGSLGSLAVLALTGFALGIGGPSRDLMIRRVTPKGATGRVYGLVYSGFDAGFALAPAVFGLFIDRGWYAGTLVGGATTLLISVLLALRVSRLKPMQVV